VIDTIDNVNRESSLQLRHRRVDLQRLASLTGHVREACSIQGTHGSQNLENVFTFKSYLDQFCYRTTSSQISLVVI